MKAFRWVKDKFYDPNVMTRFHTASLVVWTLFVPATLLTGLKDSVPWIAFLSVWALAAASWAALQGAHGEKEQERLMADVHDTLDATRVELKNLHDDLSSLRRELRNTTGSIPGTPDGDPDVSTEGAEWPTTSLLTRRPTKDSSPPNSSPNPCPPKNSPPSPNASGSTETTETTVVRPVSPGTIQMNRRPSS